MERRVRQILNDERGVVPIWLGLAGVVFATYQIYKLMKSMNREIDETRKKNGPVDTLNPPVVDGEIVASPLHEDVEGQGK